jgi:hypothetical protein
MAESGRPDAAIRAPYASHRQGVAPGEAGRGIGIQPRSRVDGPCAAARRRARDIPVSMGCRECQECIRRLPIERERCRAAGRPLLLPRAEGVVVGRPARPGTSPSIAAKRYLRVRVERHLPCGPLRSRASGSESSADEPSGAFARESDSGPDRSPRSGGTRATASRPVRTSFSRNRAHRASSRPRV